MGNLGEHAYSTREPVIQACKAPIETSQCFGLDEVWDAILDWILLLTTGANQDPHVKRLFIRASVIQTSPARGTDQQIQGRALHVNSFSPDTRDQTLRL